MVSSKVADVGAGRERCFALTETHCKTLIRAKSFIINKMTDN